MELSTGRKVVERAEPNGSTFAEIEGGGEMTAAEWDEYCARIRALTLEQSRARLRNRKAPGVRDGVIVDADYWLYMDSMRNT